MVYAARVILEIPYNRMLFLPNVQRAFWVIYGNILSDVRCGNIVGKRKTKIIITNWKIRGRIRKTTAAFMSRDIVAGRTIISAHFTGGDAAGIRGTYYYVYLVCVQTYMMYIYIYKYCVIIILKPPQPPIYNIVRLWSRHIAEWSRE